MEQTLAEGRGLEHLAMPTDEQVLLVASFPRFFFLSWESLSK